MATQASAADDRPAGDSAGTDEVAPSFTVQVESLTPVLAGITDMDSATKAVADLERLGRPLFDALMDPQNEARTRLQTDHAAAAAFTAMQEEIGRIGSLGEDVAEVVMGALLGQERMAATIAKAREAKAKAIANQLRQAITTYFVEYRRYPVEGNDGGDSQLSSDAGLMACLLGKVEHALNPRRIAFLSVDADSGVDDTGALIDPWGTPYRIILDTGYNDLVSPPDDYEGSTDVSEPILIDSAGPDGDFSTVEDNVRTW